MRRKLGVLFAILIMLIVLSACATPSNRSIPSPNSGNPVTVVPSVPTPETPLPPENPGSQAPPLVAAGEDVVIVYQSEGGIAGSSETTIIHSDGKVEIRGRDRPVRMLQTGAQQVAALVNIFEQENFFDLQSSYLPQNTCCDRMVYTITYYRNGRSKSVTTIDANPEEPAALQEVMQALNTFLAELH